MIASLAGDGIAVALASGEAAARAWLAGGRARRSTISAASPPRRRPVGIAEALRHVAERRLPRARDRLLKWPPAPPASPPA